MEEFFRSAGEKALSGEGICREEALRVLAVPPDSSFNKLSWAVPYAAFIATRPGRLRYVAMAAIPVFIAALIRTSSRGGTIRSRQRRSSSWWGSLLRSSWTRL